MFKKYFLIDSSNSFSKLFLSLNEYFKSKNNAIVIYNNNNLFKLIKKIIPDWLTPRIFKVSMTLMPDLYSGLSSNNILWIHDTLFFEEEFVFGNNKNIYEKEKTQLLERAKKAKLIVTPSEYSKEKIKNFLNIEEKKIIVQYCQLIKADYDAVLNDQIFIEKVIKKYEIQKKVKNIIFIGSPHYRKNLKTVVDVFEMLNKKIHDLNLIVVSYARKDIPITFEIYSNLINNHNIKFLSHVSNTELVALIKVSDILLNPTLEEGFGLPNIEAQICETIVVSSNTSCIPEILSNSAILVDPLNKDEIYNSCLNVLENKIDCEKIIKNGVENSLRYTDINNYDNLYKIILNLSNESVN